MTARMIFRIEASSIALTLISLYLLSRRILSILPIFSIIKQ